jgi:hypothetical protein
MTTVEFSAETKRQVSNAIDDALCYSKPLIGDEAEIALRKIIRMSLRLKDLGGREEPITEWFERDLRGPHISLDSVVRIVEKVCCHDAAFQPAGELIYVLSFHSKDHDNRSRHMFKVYGGQEVQSMSMTHGGMVRGGMGGGLGGVAGLMQSEIGIAERLMPEVLKYSAETMAAERRFLSEKEQRLTDQSKYLFDTLMKREQHLTEIIQNFTDKETNVREIEISARGLEYEQKKKEKADEEAEAFKKRILDGVIAGLEKHGPKLAMLGLSMLQRRGGEALPPEFNEWYQEQKRAAKKSKPKTNGQVGLEPNHGHSNDENKPVSPAASTGVESVADAKVNSVSGSVNGSAGNVVDAKIEEEEEEEEEEGDASDVLEDDEPSEVEKLRLSVALQTASFFALVRARGKWNVIREALEPGPLQLWDAIAEATTSEDAASDQGLTLVAQMALMFGAMVQGDPGVGIALHGALDDFCKVALVNLAKLLEEYHQAGGT